MKYTDYEKQVNGWNHKMTYSTDNGKQKKITVYENPDGNCKIVSEAEPQLAK